MAGRPKKQTTTASTTVKKNAVVEDSQNVVVEDVKKEVIELEPLKDSDEIEVEALIPNLSFKDEKTYDYFEWAKSGDTERVTFESLRNMYRNYRGYFKNLWVRPLDERVINEFKLNKLYEDYDKVMNIEEYTTSNVQEICEKIRKLSNSSKLAVISSIREKVDRGDIVNVQVIKQLESGLGIDLMSLI